MQKTLAGKPVAVPGDGLEAGAIECYCSHGSSPPFENRSNPDRFVPRLFEADTTSGRNATLAMRSEGIDLSNIHRNCEMSYVHCTMLLYAPPGSRPNWLYCRAGAPVLR
jgi:hypothetical protein